MTTHAQLAEPSLTTHRLVRCRMTDRFKNPCSAEAVDPEGQAIICLGHLMSVLQLAGEQPGITVIIEPLP